MGARQETMTKGERESLLRLIKQRERVQKGGIEQRAAELLADFEVQISTLYKWDQEEVWAAAVECVTQEVDAANERILKRAKELGIPEQFAPRITYQWNRRYENAIDDRRNELRRTAKARIEAIAQGARVKVETTSVEAQTRVMTAGLTSEAAVGFLESLPSIDNMMPTVDVAAIEDLMRGGGRYLSKPADVVPLRLVDHSTEEPDGEPLCP